MLPRSEHSVFTHGDIAPRNVMVDEKGNVSGILDWETAMWYPDDWEHAQIMRPAFWGDLSLWMEKRAWYAPELPIVVAVLPAPEYH
ncbi:hypothetical protein N7520_010176 [Penicillium odoratum]|uniref:uncharacterized protein n=1 Tax=Penicillium odoratum TaxID=1167516 RepID=UPI002548DAEA|nr:uncharacterized protein N7520_010176 [Penicillium odoratum]KAJ5753259.1 hypothetical protein N7520_010176 [Penicillium odoratum]